MSDLKGINFHYSTIKCPICGKEFHATPERGWRIGETVTSQRVCSYSCMRKWEKQSGFKRRGDKR